MSEWPLNYYREKKNGTFGLIGTNHAELAPFLTVTSDNVQEILNWAVWTFKGWKYYMLPLKSSLKMSTYLVRGFFKKVLDENPKIVVAAFI